MPDITWKEKGSTVDLKNGIGRYSVSTQSTPFGRGTKLTFIADKVNEDFICTATNERGTSEQQFSVLNKSKFICQN